MLVQYAILIPTIAFNPLVTLQQSQEARTAEAQLHSPVLLLREKAVGRTDSYSSPPAVSVAFRQAKIITALALPLQTLPFHNRAANQLRGQL